MILNPKFGIAALGTVLNLYVTITLARDHCWIQNPQLNKSSSQLEPKQQA